MKLWCSSCSACGRGVDAGRDGGLKKGKGNDQKKRSDSGRWNIFCLTQLHLLSVELPAGNIKLQLISTSFFSLPPIVTEHKTGQTSIPHRQDGKWSEHPTSRWLWIVRGFFAPKSQPQVYILKKAKKMFILVSNSRRAFMQPVLLKGITQLSQKQTCQPMVFPSVTQKLVVVPKARKALREQTRCESPLRCGNMPSHERQNHKGVFTHTL